MSRFLPIVILPEEIAQHVAAGIKAFLFAVGEVSGLRVFDNL
jgi:hypothetical protein